VLLLLRLLSRVEEIDGESLEIDVSDVLQSTLHDAPCLCSLRRRGRCAEANCVVGKQGLSLRVGVWKCADCRVTSVTGGGVSQKGKYKVAAFEWGNRYCIGQGLTKRIHSLLLFLCGLMTAMCL